ncbi:MAG: DUF3313 family protein [Asticcacaulis sp.]
MMRLPILIVAGLSALLTACISAPAPVNSSLTTIDNIKPDRTGRTTTRRFSDTAALSTIKRVYLHPTQLMTPEDARYELADNEKALVLAEVEAQLCFELAERYEVVTDIALSDAEVRSAVIWFEPTGTVGSGAAAVANFFIPGPIGLRLPGTLGGLGAEAEMLQTDKQIAAIVWVRQAQAVGTDTPSLSRLGDALQFAEPFGDDAAAAMSPDPLPQKRSYTQETDPCLKYGGRINETGFIIDRLTGLYVPASRPPSVSDTQPVAPD